MVVTKVTTYRDLYTLKASSRKEDANIIVVYDGKFCYIDRSDPYRKMLIGAQAAGEAGIVSRINTFSAALWSGLGLEEIGYLDLAYAPPFSGAWDIIHNAAQALLRKL